MSNENQANDEKQLLVKDTEALAEALIEHIATLNESQQLVIDGIVEGIDSRIRTIVNEELDKREKLNA